MNHTPSPPPTLPHFLSWEEIRSLIGSIRTRSLVARPKTVDDCRETLAYCREHGLALCPRGAGRSYGDMALLDTQVVLDTSGMNRVLGFDEDKRQITVEGGTRLIDIFEVMHHKRLTLCGCPTESHSSVAGAICANVNGKDAWRRGSFGSQVVRLKLMTADGEVRAIESSDELYDAVAGGLGLLGIVLEATLQLQPVASPFVETQVFAASNVDELLKRLDEVEKTSDALVVWVDAYARGKNIGRSVVHATRWIERPEDEAQLREHVRKGIEKLASHRRLGLGLHAMFGPAISLMLHAQRPMLRFFNKLYYAKSKMGEGSKSVELFLQFSFAASFTVPPAHLVCGPRGYTIQLTFPRTHARAAMVEFLEICQSSPCPPVTSVLRAHKRDDHLISFSEDGYSLNFEIHPKKRHEAASRAAVDRMIDAIVKYGGKVHMAKDQVLRPEQFRRLYPRFDELLEIKRRLDPSGMFTSDLVRRVGLIEATRAEPAGAFSAR